MQSNSTVSRRQRFLYRRAYTQRFLGAIVFGAGIIGIYWIAVRTVNGQLIDAVAMTAISQLQPQFAGIDGFVLNLVSIPAIIVLIVAAALITLFRRRFALALRLAAIIILSISTSYILKTLIFTRPDLHIGIHTTNSLPSGHVTFAATAAISLLIAISHQLRPWFALLGSLFIILMGLSVTVHLWHRPSDVVTAIFVVLFWSLLLSPLEKSNSHGLATQQLLLILTIVFVLFAAIATGMTWSMLTNSPYYLSDPTNRAAVDVLARLGYITGKMAAMSGIATICAAAFLSMIFVNRSVLIRSDE